MWSVEELAFVGVLRQSQTADARQEKPARRSPEESPDAGSRSAGEPRQE